MFLAYGRPAAQQLEPVDELGEVGGRDPCPLDVATRIGLRIGDPATLEIHAEPQDGGMQGFERVPVDLGELLSAPLGQGLDRLRLGDTAELSAQRVPILAPGPIGDCREGGDTVVLGELPDRHIALDIFELEKRVVVDGAAHWNSLSSDSCGMCLGE